MKVSIIAKLDKDWFDFKTPHTTLKSILNHLKQLKDGWYVKRIIANRCKYILVDTTGIFAPIVIREEISLQNFNKFDSLLIIEDIQGSGAAIVMATENAALMTAATATTAASLTTLGMFVAATINIAISIALQYIIQALSPTPEFANDPAATQGAKQTSNLYNGAPLIREQGGVYPLVFGRTFCGGVLISSGIYTSDVVA